MVDKLKIRISQILECDISEVPDSLKDIRKAVKAKKLELGVKHGKK